MTSFTTSKGSFVAIGGEESEKAFGPVISAHRWGSDSIIYRHQDGSETISEHDYDFEIIGLSSDILKDEELAKKVISSYCIGEDYALLVGELFKIEGITGNNLIIKKK